MTEKTPAPVFIDAYTLCQWILQHFDDQPGILAQSLCRNCLHLLEAITLALKGRLREERLEQADEYLITMRLKLRLAAGTDLLDDQQMFYAVDLVDRIGRQIGGWLRSLNEA